MEMQKGDVPETRATADLLRHLTGYQAPSGVAGGVKKFIEWYKPYDAIELGA